MNRYRYLIRKVGWSVSTIIFVVILNFFLFRVLPGDPARAGVHDPRQKKDAIEAIRVRYGLDKPVINCFETLNPVKLGSCGVNPLFMLANRNPEEQIQTLRNLATLFSQP